VPPVPVDRIASIDCSSIEQGSQTKPTTTIRVREELSLISGNIPL